MAGITKEQLEVIIRETLTDETLRTAVASAVEREVAPLRTQQTNWMTEFAGAARGAAAPPEKGRAVGRIFMALAAAKGDPDRAVRFATAHWGKDSDTTAFFSKALAAGDSGAGGFLIQEEVSSDIIELLRPASAIRQLNPVMAPLDSGRLSIPKITGGATGGYIGENQNLPVSQATFGQIGLNAKKLAVLTPISNDLLRRAGPATETMVRDDLVAGLAQISDLKFIRGTGLNGEPKGLRYQAPAANLVPAQATPDLTKVTEDARDAVVTMIAANVRMLRPGWIMAPRVWGYLMTVRDGNGNFAFRQELEAGRFWGFPFKMTSQIPTNLGSGSNESEIYLADFADVIIGEATTMLIDVSTEAAYHDGSNVVAAFSLDQTVIRAIVEHDLAVRHAESIVVITGVTWGA